MIDEPDDIAGVAVRRVDHLPDRFDGTARVGPYSSARPGLLLRDVPGVGRFLARDGNKLDYWLEPGADPDAASALLHGGVYGALIHQRGELPLHATTLVAPDGGFALALAGHSGAGKSTTAFELTRRGWMLVSDDLTRVAIAKGTPMVWPGRSRLRLLGDACAHFGLDPAGLAPVPNWPGKHRVDLPRWPDPVRLGAVAVLERTEENFEVRPLAGPGAVAGLIEHSYRRHYVAALGCSRRHLELVGATAGRVRMLACRGRADVAGVADALAAAVASFAAPGH